MTFVCFLECRSSRELLTVKQRSNSHDINPLDNNIIFWLPFNFYCCYLKQIRIETLPLMCNSNSHSKAVLIPWGVEFKRLSTGSVMSMAFLRGISLLLSHFPSKFITLSWFLYPSPCLFCSPMHVSPPPPRVSLSSCCVNWDLTCVRNCFLVLELLPLSDAYLHALASCKTCVFCLLFRPLEDHDTVLSSVSRSVTTYCYELALALCIPLADQTQHYNGMWNKGPLCLFSP